MPAKNDSLLWNEFRPFRAAFASLLFFSFILALMYLVPSIFMQQLFQRVFQSRSIETLLVLAVLVAFLCAIWTAIEVIRVKALYRIALALDDRISRRVFDALNRQTDTLPSASRMVVLQDLQVLRDVLSSPTITQALDLVWVPVILGAAFLYHPILGLTLTGLTVLVVILALVSQLIVRDDAKRSLQSAARAGEFGRAVMANAEATRVMGMLPALVRTWHQRQQAALGWQASAARRSAFVGSLIKYARHVYSPVMLTVGTLLYLDQLVGAGVIFAASILTSRAVIPVDGIASSWRQIWNARLSAGRLETMLREAAKRSARVELAPPHGPLVLSRVMASPRNKEAAVLTDVSFAVEPGRVLGVVGASGAGKSSLARVLVGAWEVRKGSVSLDGNDLSHWDQDKLGRYVGYVQQDVELLPGTVAENIARFDEPSEARDAALLEAARIAGVQDIIQRLPDGFNTRLGPDGHAVSGGQRQRLALARAVYGSPKLLVLDEPNSNLDATGEESLGRTIATMRESGAIVVIITHRMNILALCDQVLVMNAGTVYASGPREQMLDRLAAATSQRQIALAPSIAAQAA